jgi:diketogulonate reductase-like aldo/keto reductase
MTSIPSVTLKNGFSMPLIGFGTWQMGNRTSYGPGDNHDAEVSIIRSAVDHGMIHIDTAELYGNGFVEEMIATSLSGLDRSSYMLTSKVKGDNATKEAMRGSLEGSLKRLKTDYLDLYLIHWRNSDVDLQESIEALNELAEEGLVKNIGVSNFHPDTLAEAQSFSKHPLVANQVQYNMKHREAEDIKLVEYCQKHDTILTAWGPMHPLNSQISSLPLMKELCEKYDKTPGQIAISYLTSQKNVCTLAKTTSEKHLIENIEATQFSLEQADWERIKDEFPDQDIVSNSLPMS